METSKSIDFVVLIIIATMGIFILVFFIILLVLLYQKKVLASRNQMIDMEKSHQKKLLDTSLEIAEHERRRIAANLHDEVGAVFYTLKMNFTRLRRKKDDAEEFEKVAQSSIEDIENAMDLVRSIYNDILPSGFKTGNLVNSFNDLSKLLNQNSGINVSYQHNDGPLTLDKEKQVQLYRLAKEILNNTLKHAAPQNININLETNKETLIVTILHDGTGISTERVTELAKVSKGIGLKSILTRSELLHATVDFLAPANENPRVVIRMLTV